MCTVLLPPGVNPIAVNIYIYIYIYISLSHIGREGVSPVILNLVNRRKQFVDFIPRTFYFHGKRPVVVKQKTVYVPSRSGCLAEENEISSMGTTSHCGAFA
jgi:hypothetical protein